MSKALHQIIAIEKGVKSRVYAEVSTLHKLAQKPTLFEGISRNYAPKDDGGEQLPSENKRVQNEAVKMIARASALMTEAMDVEAAKDWANCKAVADIAIEGKVLIKDAPATYMLYLEKQLSDLKAFVGEMPTLDEAEEWTHDASSGLHRSAERKTHRTKKVERPIVLYPATDKHPAQTQLITDDIIDGYWSTVRTSGALTPLRKELLLGRIERLSDAVKMAREKANSVDAPDQNVGRPVFAFLFG